MVYQQWFKVFQLWHCLYQYVLIQDLSQVTNILIKEHHLITLNHYIYCSLSKVISKIPIVDEFWWVIAGRSRDPYIKANYQIHPQAIM